MRIRHILMGICFVYVSLALFGCDKDDDDEENDPRPAKPIIYLYPEETTEVSVQFGDIGELEITTTYPDYGSDGWTVIAEPDGTLTDSQTGEEYYALYWEGKEYQADQLTTGIVIPGEDTASFLEDSLNKLGLNRREAAEFIIYWLPVLESNPYNFIHFSTTEWNETVPLQITPGPDTLIRVMMFFEPLNAPLDISPQQLAAPERTGFVAVEWGGAEIFQFR